VPSVVLVISPASIASAEAFGVPFLGEVVTYSPVSRAQIRARRFWSIGGNMSVKFAYYTGGLDTVANSASATLSIDAEGADENALATLAADSVTITNVGWYAVEVSVGFYSNSADFNGSIYVGFDGVGLSNTGEHRGYVTAWGVSSDELVISIPLIQVTQAATKYIKVVLTNDLGVEIDAYINSVSLFKLN
jgi:hypothetical protein